MAYVKRDELDWRSSPICILLSSVWDRFHLIYQWPRDKKLISIHLDFWLEKLEDVAGRLGRTELSFKGNCWIQLKSLDECWHLRIQGWKKWTWYKQGRPYLKAEMSYPQVDSLPCPCPRPIPKAWCPWLPSCWLCWHSMMGQVLTVRLHAVQNPSPQGSHWSSQHLVAYWKYCV